MFRAKYPHETEEEYRRRKRQWEQQEEEDSASAAIVGGVIAAEIIAESETPSVPDSTGDSSPSVDAPSADPTPDFGGFDGGSSGGGGASGDF